MIIWLASFPRSGNSFFRFTSKTVFARDVYSIYPEEKAISADDLENMRQDSEVHLVKTHELPSDSSPAIYLVRDGRDSLVSYAWYDLASPDRPDTEISDIQFTKHLRKIILSKFFGGWSGNCLAWLNRPHQTVLIRFEDLIVQPEHEIMRAFDALGLSYERQENKKTLTFNQLHKRNPLLYRKGQVGGWKSQMPETLHKLFWKKHGDAMRALGYTR